MKAKGLSLTSDKVKSGGYRVSPSCESKGGSTCECQSVANELDCPGSGTSTILLQGKWPKQ
jgi:hypothetical protein